MQFDTPLGGLWGIATVIGPLLFIAVLAWAIISNRKASPRNEQIAEESAAELREDLTEERERREAVTEKP